MIDFLLFETGDKDMNMKLKKEENSNMLKLSNLKINDKLDINYDNNKISLEEKFNKYNGENLSKEFTWDEAKGKEVW